MGRLQWYKRDPYDALTGMLELTLEETGAYSKIIDLIYLHENDLRDDDRYIVGWLKCDLRIWKRLKARLIDLKKIKIEGGRIVNFRATTELEKTTSGKRSTPTYPPKSETYGGTYTHSYPPKSQTSTPSHPHKSEPDVTISKACDVQNREEKIREEKNPPYPPCEGGRKSERNSDNGSGRQGYIRQQRHTIAGSFQKAVEHLAAIEPEGGDRGGGELVGPLPRLRHGKP